MTSSKSTESAPAGSPNEEAKMMAEKHPTLAGHPIVEKGTDDFIKARNDYLALFTTDNPEDSVIGCELGLKTKQTDKKNALPMPFACPSLMLYIFPKDEKGRNAFAWFCDRGGMLCVPARSDMTEKVPNYCPPLNWEDMFSDGEEYEIGADDADWEDEEA
jgi:hypothetical protein